MEKYIYISNDKSKGRLAISLKVLDTLADYAVQQFPDVVSTKKKLILSKPVKTTIRRGIVHVQVVVDAKKGINLHETSLKLQEAIRDIFLQTVESIPFDIQVRFESIF